MNSRCMNSWYIFLSKKYLFSSYLLKRPGSKDNPVAKTFLVHDGLLQSSCPTKEATLQVPGLAEGREEENPPDLCSF